MTFFDVYIYMQQSFFKRYIYTSFNSTKSLLSSSELSSEFSTKLRIFAIAYSAEIHLRLLILVLLCLYLNYNYFIKINMQINIEIKRCVQENVKFAEE